MCEMDPRVKNNIVPEYSGVARGKVCALTILNYIILHNYTFYCEMSNVKSNLISLLSLCS